MKCFDFRFVKTNHNTSKRKGGFTKADHIQYWITTANKDWLAVKRMLECRTYVHALFFMHLVLEKLLKAHWVKDNIGNHPPKSHDLIKLLNQTNLEISKTEEKTLFDMNIFQLESRYPEYKLNLYKTYKHARTFAIFVSVNSIRKCLLRKLQ